MAWYRNIFANSHNRNPLSKINDVFVNNLLYNYSAGYTTHTSTNFKHDILNNYFVFGPASTGTDNTWYQVDKNQSIYYAGNLKDTNRDGTLNGAATTPYWYQGEGTVLTAPWSTETNATPVLSTLSAARVAISLAGTLPRDPVDALVISQVMTLGKGTTGAGAGTVGPDGGLYTSQAQTGLPNNGYGAIAGGTRPTDTDNDGMPDSWETRHRLEPGRRRRDDEGRRRLHADRALRELAGGLHATSAGGARSTSTCRRTPPASAACRRPTSCRARRTEPSPCSRTAAPPASSPPRASRPGVVHLHGDRLRRQRLHQRSRRPGHVVATLRVACSTRRR